MSTAIVPEVLGMETQVFEDTPMTPTEQRKLVELETRIKTKLGNKMEADLAIGSALLQIQRERLYRGPEGGRKFEDYIDQESHKLTPDGQAIGQKSAAYLRGFYYFREEVLPGSGSNCSGTQGLPLPTSAAQVRPLLFLLDHLRRDAGDLDSRAATYDDRRAAEAKALDIWKAAVTEAKGSTPTFDQVNRARLADTAAEQHRLRGSANSTPPQQQPPSAPYVSPTREEIMAMANHDARENCEPLPFPGATVRDAVVSRGCTIVPWELQKEESTLDAGGECKRITSAITEAHKAIGLLRGILYSQINKYGRDYLGVLRQVDAGVYSLNNIDDQVQQMAEDIAFISDLLIADVGEGELAQSTINVAAMPTRA